MRRLIAGLERQIDVLRRINGYTRFAVDTQLASFTVLMTAHHFATTTAVKRTMQFWVSDLEASCHRGNWEWSLLPMAKLQAQLNIMLGS